MSAGISRNHAAETKRWHEHVHGGDISVHALGQGGQKEAAMGCWAQTGQRDIHGSLSRSRMWGKIRVSWSEEVFFK